MIVPMKRVSLIVLAYEKRKALKTLRQSGIVHIDEVPAKNEKVEDLERSLQQIDRSIIQLQELYTIESKKTKEKLPLFAEDALDDEEFSEIQTRVLWLLDHKRELEEKKQKTIIERDSLKEWGDFSVSDISHLYDSGITLNFYKIGKKELHRVSPDTDYISLSETGKTVLVATVGNEFPEETIAQKLNMGQKSLSELCGSIDEDQDQINQIQTELIGISSYLQCFRRHKRFLEQDHRFELVHAGMEEDDTVSWLTGFIPEDAVSSFKNTASGQGWAYVIDDPSDDELPPTLVKNSRWVSIIGPVFDILGTVPGYREYDISMWFLMFFSLFFAMIVGDGAYGVIFLIAGILIHRKIKKANNAVILLYVLSTTSIIWGALTGTWFGSKAILEAVPFLQMLVIPQIANYPELFGLEATTTQNMVMQFCFIVGTLQLSLACAMNIYRKLGKKDLSALADVGWLVMIDALYFLVLMLVINAEVAVSLVASLVGLGFLFVVVFGAQGPGISFIKGLAGGAANLFTTFLNSISAFSNIISYIRLFAVGMASLAIAQSFNNMASGLLQGFALPAGILILIIGHGLNLIMALLSVVVHGVRLNLLEFSGQLGMEWTGFTYDPFRETVETSSQTL
jgi:V/A-type H+-transporting ATPase subunit I